MSGSGQESNRSFFNTTYPERGSSPMQGIPAVRKRAASPTCCRVSGRVQLMYGIEYGS